MTDHIHDIEIIIDNQTFNSSLQQSTNSVKEFGINVILQGTKTFSNNISATDRISIKWNDDLFPYAFNPSNIVFKIDNQICLHNGITVDMNNNTVTYLMNINSEFSELSIYLFEHQLSNNMFNFSIPKAYTINHIDNETYTAFNFNFPHTYENVNLFDITSYNIVVPRCIDFLHNQIQIQPILWYFWNLNMNNEFEYNLLYEEIQW